MTPWEVIEQALALRKPPRSQAWLAEQLGVKPQAVTNWRMRGAVPTAQYRPIANLLGLTVNQVEGIDPPPWEKETGWPFPGIEQARFDRLDDIQKGEIQGKVREMIEGFERAAQSGKSSPSRDGAGHKNAA